MKIDKLKFDRSINAFLQNKELSVAVINGAWGVGKTYHWENNIIKKYMRDTKIGSEKYTYISLFGINSKYELKRSLLINNNTSNLRELSVSQLLKIDDANHKDLIVEIEFNKFLDRKIICFDDIERKGDELKLLDLFSIIDLAIKEKCKIILILNFDVLSKETQNKFNLYKEKIIDLEIEFCPNYLELTNIYFQNLKHIEKKEIAQQLKFIELKNLRVIYKSKLLIDRIRENNKVKLSFKLNNILVKLILVLVGSYYKSTKFVYEELKLKLMILNAKSYQSLDLENKDFNENFIDINLVSKDLINCIDHYLIYGYYDEDEIKLSIADSEQNYTNKIIKSKFKFIDNILLNMLKKKDSNDSELMILLEFSRNDISDWIKQHKSINFINFIELLISFRKVEDKIFQEIGNNTVMALEVISKNTIFDSNRITNFLE